jgi:hypothetical protein
MVNVKWLIDLYILERGSLEVKRFFSFRFQYVPSPCVATVSIVRHDAIMLVTR